MCLSLTKASRKRGDRQRDARCGAQCVDEVIRHEETEPDRALGAVNRLSGLAACRARLEVGGGGGREAQPTAWAANVGHDRPFP